MSCFFCNFAEGNLPKAKTIKRNLVTIQCVECKQRVYNLTKLGECYSCFYKRRKSDAK